MRIRNITKSDIRILAKIFDQYRVFYEQKSNIIGSNKFLLERFENKQSKIFVAENELYEIIGFIQLYPIFSSTRMNKLWLLNDLFFSEKFRGKGVSVLLIEEAKKLCKKTNACGLILETAKTNEIGNSLYPKTGFLLDLEHNYYSWENTYQQK